MLTFIIVFNEYLVTLFVHPPEHHDGARCGSSTSSGPPASRRPRPPWRSRCSSISFAAVLLFFRLFGTRHLKGTYLL